MIIELIFSTLTALSSPTDIITTPDKVTINNNVSVKRCIRIKKELSIIEVGRRSGVRV